MNPRRTNGWQRTKLRRRILAEQTHCALCQQPVDKTLNGTVHPGAPEIDEIIPVSLGGSPYDYTNLQLTHRICNVRKGGANRLKQRTPQQPKPKPPHKPPTTPHPTGQW